MNDQTQRKPWLIVLLSGLTFFYFLIFAQFGYLHLLEELEGGKNLIDMAMLAMGIGGIGSCIVTARRFRIEASRSWILAGFGGSGLAAAASMLISSGWGQVIVALCVGTFLGALTVSIVPVIRAQSPFGNVGRWVSIGVGSAYFLCNVPMIFESTAVIHCLYGLIACGIGAGVTRAIPCSNKTALETGSEKDTSVQVLFGTRGVVLIAILFMGLIWLDSAAFFLIQEAGEMRLKSWGADWQLWMNAGMHFVAAVAGGWLLDRGRLYPQMAGSFAALAAGYWLVGKEGLFPTLGALLYVSGVSLYSTAFVAYGALEAESTETWRISSRAGMVFALGGWFGSAMGIGMASELGSIPVGFWVSSTIALAGCGVLLTRAAGKSTDGSV